MYWHFGAYLYRFRSLCCYFCYGYYCRSFRLLCLLLLCGWCFQFCCKKNAFLLLPSFSNSGCCRFLAISLKHKSWKVSLYTYVYVYALFSQCWVSVFLYFVALAMVFGMHFSNYANLSLNSHFDPKLIAQVQRLAALLWWFENALLVIKLKRRCTIFTNFR